MASKFETDNEASPGSVHSIFKNNLIPERRVRPQWGRIFTYKCIGKISKKLPFKHHPASHIEIYVKVSPNSVDSVLFISIPGNIVGPQWRSNFYEGIL